MKSIFLSCKIKKGMKIAHVEASNVVPSMVAPQLDENIPREVAGNAPKSNLLRNLPKEDGNRLQKLFESLNLDGIESGMDNSSSHLETF